MMDKHPGVFFLFWGGRNHRQFEGDLTSVGYTRSWASQSWWNFYVFCWFKYVYTVGAPYCTWLQLVPWRCDSKGNMRDIFLCSVVHQMVHITLYTLYSIYFICHIYMIGYPYSNETDWHQSLLITFKASLKKTVCFSSLGPSSHHGDKHETWWQISPWSVKRWRKISRIASRENVLRIRHFRYNQSYDVLGWEWDHEFLQKRGGVMGDS